MESATVWETVYGHVWEDGWKVPCEMPKISATWWLPCGNLYKLALKHRTFSTLCSYQTTTICAFFFIAGVARWLQHFTRNFNLPDILPSNCNRLRKRWRKNVVASNIPGFKLDVEPTSNSGFGVDGVYTHTVLLYDMLNIRINSFSSSSFFDWTCKPPCLLF